MPINCGCIHENTRKTQDHTIISYLGCEMSQPPFLRDPLAF